MQCNKPKSPLSFFTGLLLGYLKQLFLTPHLVRSCLNRQAKSPTLPKIPGLIPLSMGAAFGCDDPWFLKELVNRPCVHRDDWCLLFPPHTFISADVRLYIITGV
ncbi:hypothetical protein CDAR_171761 [Caerostris darwini]|uniref:Uncharacterized protein n=1 Tax=Caerostris darwini TaxID=1538125 RepID=A0AAV4QMA0_9ARAC|nr:hypothetical protein CDAR_171761 [Caerostris darwini]